jgi:uncharacterized protein YecE (DUF72 family)
MAKREAGKAGVVRVGIGGWTFAPWRGVFYPAKLPARRELEHASRHVTAIEINGTFYRSQGPKSFAKWRDETPDGFVFAVKGHRAVVNAKKLADAGGAIEWFFKSGIGELKEKLGPVLWQLAPFKKFDAEDLGAFFALLPKELDGAELRHAVEVRSKSFLVPEFVELARKHGVAIVFADSDVHPAIADATADFAYLRLQRSVAEVETGYTAAALDEWAGRARTWAKGDVPEELPQIGGNGAKAAKRDVFVFFIAGAKERNPAAAEALIERLKA